MSFPDAPLRATARDNWLELLIRAAFWLAIATTVALALGMNRSPMPWVDETLMGSGALSIARGGNGIPTYTGAPEQMLPFHWFYGPVYFKISGWAMRWFGETITVYRSVSLASSILMLLAFAFYARVLSHSRFVIVLALTTAIFLPEFGSRLTSGRMDPLAVAFMVGGLALFVAALQSEARNRRLTLLIGGAVVFGLGMLTTPRCFPMAVGLAVASAIAALLRPEIRRRVIVHLFVYGGVSLLMVSAWTFAQGLSPLGWLHIIRSASQGDAWNSSPVLGGNWNFRLAAPTLITTVMLVLAMPAVLIARLRGAESRLSASEIIAMVSIIVHSILTMLVISRPFDYIMFWGTPLLVTAVILSHPLWRRQEPAEGGAIGARRPTLVVSFFLFVILAGGLLRLGKLADLALSWEARDPGPINEFIRENVPRGTYVFGPHGLYWWAVEDNGSHYVSAEGWKQVARKDLPPGYDPTPALGPRPAPLPLNGQMMIWPDRDPMPSSLQCAFAPVAKFTPSERPAERFWDRFIRRHSSYPPATLYRMDSCSRVS